MRSKAYVASGSSTATNDAMVRRKQMWIIFGIIVGIVTITAIVVPVTIVLTRETYETTTTMAMETTEVTTSEEISSTTNDCIFTSPTNYYNGSGFSPSCATTVDVNGDNKLDIIVVNQATNNVDVLFNTDIGTFHAQVTYSTGSRSSPSSVATADLDGDNKLDIIVGNQETNNVGIFLNTGIGTFNAQVTYSTGSGSSPRSVATADVDGDKKLDIIVANFNKNRVGVLFNTGIGTFDNQVTYSTGFGSSPISVATADVNGDKKPDIIVANIGTGNVGVLLNTGNGTFNAQVIYNTGSASYASSVTIADLDGNNKPDIIIATSRKMNNVGILLNTGTGTFNAQVIYSTGFPSFPSSVATVDVNSDKQLDTIVANTETGNVGILLNKGNGTFDNQVTYPTGFGSYSHFVTIADVNGDKKPDIIAIILGSRIDVILAC